MFAETLWCRYYTTLMTFEWFTKTMESDILTDESFWMINHECIVDISDTYKSRAIQRNWMPFHTYDQQYWDINEKFTSDFLHFKSAFVLVSWLFNFRIWLLFLCTAYCWHREFSNFVSPPTPETTLPSPRSRPVKRNEESRSLCNLLGCFISQLHTMVCSMQFSTVGRIGPKFFFSKNFTFFPRNCRQNHLLLLARIL